MPYTLCVQPLISSQDSRPIPRIFWLFIPFATLLAMGQSIFSEFFMDDFSIIINEQNVINGTWKLAQLRQIPYYIWSSIYASYGYLPLPYHVANFLLHLACTATVAVTALELSKNAQWFNTPAQRINFAFYSALIFGVHPASTEAVNYARCLQIMLVTFFSVLAVWAALKIIRIRGLAQLPWVIALLCFTAGATFSKQPGIIHATLAVLIVFLPTISTKIVSQVRERDTNIIAFASLFFLCAVIFRKTYQFWLEKLIRTLNSNLFEGHVLTQGRAIWYYIKCFIFPTNLNSDHWIMESTSFADKHAVIQTLAFLIVCLLIFVIYFRQSTKFVGILAALCIAPLAIRFGYINYEHIVEYRMHPSVPWVSIMIGAIFAALHHLKGKIWKTPAILAVAAFVYLSSERCAEWNNTVELSKTTLEVAPLNNRTRSRITSELIMEQRWDEAIREADQALAAFRDIHAMNIKMVTSGRRFNPIMTLDALAHTQQAKVYALAETKSVEIAIAFSDAVSNELLRYAQSNMFIEDDRYDASFPIRKAKNELERFGSEYKERRRELLAESLGLRETN